MKLAEIGRSIVQYKHRVGYWTKGEGETQREKFVSLTNFSLKLLKYVKAPIALVRESGFVLKVTQQKLKVIFFRVRK